MRRTLGCIGLALALVLLPAAFAQDKDKKPGAYKPAPADKDKKPDADKDAPKEKKEAADKLVIAGEITGKLTRWEGVDKPFTVQVTLNYNAPDPNAVKQLADLEGKYQVALLKKDLKGALDQAMNFWARCWSTSRSAKALCASRSNSAGTHRPPSSCSPWVRLTRPPAKRPLDSERPFAQAASSVLGFRFMSSIHAPSCALALATLPMQRENPLVW